MSITLIDLPFDNEALAPALSAETFSWHHGVHHKAYIDKTNAAIAGTDLAEKSLEQVIAAARGGNPDLFNSAAQSWNHGFFWHSLAPHSNGPSGDLGDAIDTAFGSLGDLQDQLAERGADHFASGWVWLAQTDGTLSIEETHDGDTLADSCLVDSGRNPLLVIDLWEHAYYLDHHAGRQAYLKAVIAGHLNWEFAADNLARGTAWAYPG